MKVPVICALLEETGCFKKTKNIRNFSSRTALQKSTICEHEQFNFALKTFKFQAFPKASDCFNSHKWKITGHI